MGNADSAGSVLVGYQSLKVPDLSLGLVDGELPVVVHKGEAGAIVAAVFKTGKPLEQYRRSLPVTYVSYYSTHIAIIFLKNIAASTQHRGGKDTVFTIFKHGKTL